MARRRFIRWTDEEKALLTERARELMQGGVRSPLAALKRAQVVLPKSRRRTLLYMAQVPWFEAKPSSAQLRHAPEVQGMTELPRSTSSSVSLVDIVMHLFAKLLREALERALEGSPVPSRGAAKGAAARRRRAK